MVIVPTLLAMAARTSTICSKPWRSAIRQSRLQSFFALLTDFRDAPEQSQPDDELCSPMRAPRSRR